MRERGAGERSLLKRVFKNFKIIVLRELKISVVYLAYSLPTRQKRTTLLRGMNSNGTREVAAPEDGFRKHGRHHSAERGELRLAG